MKNEKYHETMQNQVPNASNDSRGLTFKQGGGGVLSKKGFEKRQRVVIILKAKNRLKNVGKIGRQERKNNNNE